MGPSAVIRLTRNADVRESLSLNIGHSAAKALTSTAPSALREFDMFDEHDPPIPACRCHVVGTRIVDQIFLVLDDDEPIP
jgi:hypothetical protein